MCAACAVRTCCIGGIYVVYARHAYYVPVFVIIPCFFSFEKVYECSALKLILAAHCCRMAKRNTNKTFFLGICPGTSYVNITLLIDQGGVKLVQRHKLVRGTGMSMLDMVHCLYSSSRSSYYCASSELRGRERAGVSEGGLRRKRNPAQAR